LNVAIPTFARAQISWMFAGRSRVRRRSPAPSSWRPKLPCAPRRGDVAVRDRPRTEAEFGFGIPFHRRPRCVKRSRTTRQGRSHWRQGRIRAIALTSTRRWSTRRPMPWSSSTRPDPSRSADRATAASPRP